MHKIKKWSLSILLIVGLTMPVMASEFPDLETVDESQQVIETEQQSDKESVQEETEQTKESETLESETVESETSESETDTIEVVESTEEISADDTTERIEEQVKSSVPQLSSVQCTGFQLQISWNNQEMYEPSGYYLYRKNENGGWRRIADLTPDKNNYVDKTVECDQKYFYTLRAYKMIDGKSYISDYNREGVMGIVRPEAPEMTVKEVNYKTVQLSWNSIQNADEYTLYRWNASTKKWDYQTTTKNTSYKLSVVCGKSYTYTVRARKNRDGKIERGSYDKKGITFKTKLPTPVLKKAISKSYNKIQLSWDKVDGAQKYEIYRKQEGKGYKYLGTTSQVSYTDSVICGEKYTYTVRAYRVDSGVRLVSGYDKSGLTASAILSTPVLKAANGSNYKKIEISWGPVEGATAYYVYRKAVGEEWRRIGEVSDISQTTFKDTTADAHRVYTYTVRALRSENGKNTLSQYDRAGICWLDSPSVSDVKATRTSVSFHWTPIQGADKYLVYRKQGSGAWERIAVVEDAKETNYNDINCSEDMIYRYTVRACITTGKKTTLSDYEHLPMPVVCLNLEGKMHIQSEGNDSIQMNVSVQNHASERIVLGNAMMINGDTGNVYFFDAYTEENEKVDTIKIANNESKEIVYKCTENAIEIDQDVKNVLMVYMTYEGEEYLLCISQNDCYVTGGSTE